MHKKYDGTRRVARTEVECAEVAAAEREALRPGAEARHACGVCVPGVTGGVEPVLKLKSLLGWVDSHDIRSHKIQTKLLAKNCPKKALKNGGLFEVCFNLIYMRFDHTK